MKLIIFFLLVGATHSLFAAPAPAQKPADKPKVLTQEITFLDDKKRIIIPVKVEAKIQSLMSADIEGHVTRIVKPLGTPVKAGEVVLYLENKDPGFTYAAVPVRTPIAGVISQIWTSQMAKVNRGDKLFTVISPKSLKLMAEIPSTEMSSIQSGMVGQFKMNSEKDLLPLRVTGISPLVDTRTGTASAELEFTDLKKKLPPIGSIGQATFEISQGKIFMVPESALVFQEGKPMIRLLKGNDHFTKKSIELGEQRDNSFVVKSGLAQGDKILVRSSRPLKENDILEIETPAATEKTQ